MVRVTLDFETSSFCDLKKAGASRYAQDPNTEVLSLVYCVGFSVGVAEYHLWKPGCDDILLPRLAADPTVQFVSHASFEQEIWRWLMVPVFGFASIPIARWVDTQAACALHAIPLDLDHALSVMGLSVTKDLDGRRVTLSLSKINKKTGMLPVRTPELMEKVYDYNRVDVVGTVALARALGDLPPSERRVWEIDQAINQRGICVDVPFVSACRLLVKRGTVPLLREFEAITGLKPTQGEKFLAWLAAEGVDLPNLKKETVASILGEGDDDDNDETWADGLPDLPEHARRALHVRSLVGHASLKKLDSMAACVGVDGRARGLIQYHAASTGRWAGRILQPQNFPRGDVRGGDVEARRAAISTAEEQAIRNTFTLDGRPCDPLELVVASLRHCLVAAPNHVLVAGDFSGIEARIVLALAGQHDKTALMASGVDVYCDMASAIYNRVISKEKDPEARQTGKNTVLGCGFQMGRQKFRARYCPDQSEEFAQRVIEAYRKEWAPMVPELWRGLERAALSACHNPGEVFWSHDIGYKVEEIGGTPFMVCRLLDGKCLYYCDPRPIMKEMPWSTPENRDIRPAWKYRAKRLGQWKWMDAYGGLLTENVVQALARQLLCRAMERLSDASWPIVLTVHDEIVCEMPEGKDWTHELEAIMCEPVQWATDIKVPVQVECWQGPYYKK
jgi:DNA polymerase bacteriophage-type